MNANQLLYQVKGYTSFNVNVAPSLRSTTPSQVTLEIKPVKVKDDVVVYAARTPSRVDEDSAEILREQKMVPGGQLDDEVTRQEPNNDVAEGEGDPLQQEIAKAKAVEHLVNPACFLPLLFLTRI